MKKFFLVFAAMFVLAASASAQSKGDMAAGIKFDYGTGDNLSNIGLGVKYQYNVIDNLRIEPSFTYFFKKDNISMWDISANVHYQFELADRFTLYPLAGLSVMGVKASYGGFSASDNDFGVNLGVGCDFDLTDYLILDVEAKYRIAGDWSRFMVGIGLGYKF